MFTAGKPCPQQQKSGRTRAATPAMLVAWYSPKQHDSALTCKESAACRHTWMRKKRGGCVPQLMSTRSACLLQCPTPEAAHGQQELPRHINTRASTRSCCAWQPAGNRAARPGRACSSACVAGRWGQSTAPDAPTTTTLSAAWLQSSGDSPYTVLAVASPSTSVCESAVVTDTEGAAPSLTLRSLPARARGSEPRRAGT
jgi:hypothetical protein